MIEKRRAQKVVGRGVGGTQKTGLGWRGDDNEDLDRRVGGCCRQHPLLLLRIFYE